MCGIFGILSKKPVKVLDILTRAKRLEYRGYDSSGFVTKEGVLIKKVGKIDELIKIVDKNLKSDCIIVHLRWTTHGEVSDENAHPHFDCNKEIFIVHNGTIENYKELREELKGKGHKFVSETDSEVFAHFIEEGLKNGKSLKEIIREIFEKFKGTYAVLLIFKGKKKLVGIKKDSPLVVGISNDAFYFSSDVYSFIDKTQKIIVLDDFEWFVADESGIKFYDRNGKEIRKEVKKLKFIDYKIECPYEHFMIKEIFEQPLVSKILIDSLKTEQKSILERFCEEIENSSRVIFLGAGSSYNSSLLGSYFLRKVGIDSIAILASEYKYWKYNKDDLVIAVSQSGETMDVILAIKDLRRKVRDILAVVNVPYSTIQRMAKVSLEIKAGFEKCVAATKTYTNQVIAFLAIAKKLGLKVKLDRIPEEIKKTIDLNIERIKKIAKEWKDEKDIYIIGKGPNYYASQEIALKLKEIAYIHAEALAGGELKHGTLALIEKGTKVIALGKEEIETNIKEIESRGGVVLRIGEDLYSSDDENIYPLTSVICGQLLTYFIAKNKNLPIDYPRNLAKTITVV